MRSWMSVTYRHFPALNAAIFLLTQVALCNHAFAIIPEMTIPGYTRWVADHDSTLQMILKAHQEKIKQIVLDKDIKNDNERAKNINDEREAVQNHLLASYCDISTKVKDKKNEFLKTRNEHLKDGPVSTESFEKELEKETKAAFRNWIDLQLKRDNITINILPLEVLKLIGQELYLRDLQALSCVQREPVPGGVSLRRIGNDVELRKKASEKQVTTKTGAVYYLIAHHPQLGKAWKDPRGLYWSDQVYGKADWKDAYQECLNLNPKDLQKDVEKKLKERESRLIPLRNSYELLLRIRYPNEPNKENPRARERDRLRNEMRKVSLEFGEIPGCYLPSREESEVLAADSGFNYEQNHFSPEVFSDRRGREYWTSSSHISRPGIYAFSLDEKGSVDHYYATKSTRMHFRCTCGKLSLSSSHGRNVP